MPMSLGTRSQPGFDRPLELMKDCHRRIERFIDVLIRVVDETAGGPLPDEHRRALEADHVVATRAQRASADNILRLSRG